MRVSLVFISLILVSLSSCGNVVRAKVDCVGKRFVVVPFSVETGSNSFRYYQSNEGIKLAQLMASQIVQGDARAEVVQVDEDFKGKVMSPFGSPDWKSLCEEYKLDFIVIGKITEYQLRDPRDLNLMQGKINVNMFVVGKNNHLVLTEQDYQFAYPEERSRDRLFERRGHLAINMSEGEVKEGLRLTTAVKLSRLFYDHVPDDKF